MQPFNFIDQLGDRVGSYAHKALMFVYVRPRAVAYITDFLTKFGVVFSLT